MNLDIQGRSTRELVLGYRECIFRFYLSRDYCRKSLSQIHRFCRSGQFRWNHLDYSNQFIPYYFVHYLIYLFFDFDPKYLIDLGFQCLIGLPQELNSIENANDYSPTFTNFQTTKVSSTQGFGCQFNYKILGLTLNINFIALIRVCELIVDRNRDHRYLDVNSD